MRIRRFLSLSLALVLLFSCSALFVACGKGNQVKTSARKARVELGTYRIVYGEYANGASVSSSFRLLISDFAVSVQNATGTLPDVVRASQAESDPDAREILIGDTGRAESQRAASAIKGDGFAIRVTKSKIVIVGSNALMTLHALSLFTEQYLSLPLEDGIARVSRSMRAGNVEMMTVAATEQFDLQVVYDKNADTNPGFEDPAALSDDKYDLSYYFAKQTRERMIKLTGATDSPPLSTDGRTATCAELLFGRVNRDACREALAMMGGEQYGVCVVDGNVVVTSWSDAGVTLAYTLFHDLLEDARQPSDNGEVYTFPTDLRLLVRGSADWQTDFPRPEGENISLYNTMDCGDGALQFLYRGKGVDESAFDAYVDTLLASGYTLHADVPVNRVEGSCFATFINEEADCVLYVAYNAFAHADELTSSYASRSSGIYKIAFGSGGGYAKPTLRIVSYRVENAHLGEEALYHPQSATKKVTDAALVSVAVPVEAVGTGYVMMLEDGSFIVFDGASSSKLYDIMSTLHLKNFGEISNEHPIHIRAWLNSHNHSDHVGAFSAFASQYGKANGANPPVKLDYIIATYPTAASCFNTTESGACTYTQVMSIANAFETPATYVEVHTGQKLYLPNATLEILYTHEDLNPHGILTGNDSSTLVRVILQPTTDGSTPTGKTTSFMWTGDMYRYGGQFACATFGDYLKSDMVSITHHGGPGADEQFFDLVAAKTVWWPSVANNIMGTGTAQKPTYGYLKEGGWHARVDQTAVYSDYAKYLFTASDYCIALFIAANGPRHSEIKRIASGVHDIDLATDHDGRNFWYKDLPIA